MEHKHKKKLLWQVPFLAFLIIGTIYIIRQQHNLPYQNNRGTIFGTTYSITYQHGTDLHELIKQELLQVDSALSMFNPHSVISHINNNESVAVNDMFCDVFLLAQQVSQDTHGAFDITVAPLVNAWGFGFKQHETPTNQQVDSLLQLIGYQKVQLTEVTGEKGQRTVTKQDPRIMLDCSAIAKGYGVDVVAQLLREKGIDNYLVEIGGEVSTRGINSKRVPWKIGVTKPTENSSDMGGELQTILNVTNKCMATSGNYRNFYYKGGRRYAHTIDPKTGFPVQHNILSATVLADKCALADAYATAFMVMGMEKAREVLQRHPDIMAYLIYDDHGNTRVWYSPSMKGKILDESPEEEEEE